jgi:sugar lactone lactonase YvrE/enterochelin esterase-like enzyme
MEVCRRSAQGLLAAALLFPAFLPARPQAIDAASPPPVIDETVPVQSDNYPLGPDSQPNPTVAAGSSFTFELTNSRIFPGTTRTITVYVPAEYKGDKPACVYVGLDGLGFNAATVFDNLIAQHAMPVTIGIGVSPGAVASASPPDNPRFDRSFEFDSRSDRLARFLLEEVIPEVERHPTASGGAIKLSGDPNDRAIGGGSTGAIAAFTVAWERPDAFRRVFSAIGTYVGMRGGEQYYVLVRKTDPKPLRIFMQDGVHDEWPGGPEMGDWWMSNQTMNRALEFAGYDVRHIWGAGSHNGSQAASVFPDAMRWLWRDWPAPIRAEAPGNPVLKTILEPGEDWQVVADGCVSVTNLAANPQGQIFYPGPGGAEVSEIVAGGKQLQCSSSTDAAAVAFAADGRVYTTRSEGGIKVTEVAHGPSKILGQGLDLANLTVRNNGDIYALTRTANLENELWLIRANGEKIRLDRDLQGASGVALSPDGLWLFVAQALSRAGLSYRVRPDGTVDAREAFYDFYVPSWADDSGAAGMGMDRDGRAYVATRMGVQVFDRNGRVAAILPLPGNAAGTGLCFGGHDFDTLYVAGGGKVYRRKLRVPGAPPWGAPLKLPPWGAG